MPPVNLCVESSRPVILNWWALVADLFSVAFARVKIKGAFILKGIFYAAECRLLTLPYSGAERFVLLYCQVSAEKEH